MNIAGAVVAGAAGTAVFSLLMAMAPRMGMPKMAIWDLLGSMFDPGGNAALGWGAHLMMGVVFALVYAFLWNSGIGSATAGGGLIFGAIHFLIVGVMMGGLPMMHAGIKTGAIKAPGVLMLNSGMMGALGGLLGHLVFGLTVALVYGAYAS